MRDKKFGRKESSYNYLPKKDIKITKSSGNVFKDLGFKNYKELSEDSDKKRIEYINKKKPKATVANAVKASG